MTTIDTATLRDWQANSQDFILVDTLPAEPFAKGHLPGAINIVSGVQVANYHHATVQALVELLNILGLRGLEDVRSRHINRRINQEVVMSYEQIYPCIPKGCLLDEATVPDDWKQDWESASAASWR